MGLNAADLKNLGSGLSALARHLADWGDTHSITDPTRFREDPKPYEGARKGTTRKTAEADPDFSQEAEKRVADIGPTISVFQDIVDGKVVLGGEGDVKSGQVSVNQKVQKADAVTGWKGNIGR